MSFKKVEGEDEFSKPVMILNLYNNTNTMCNIIIVLNKILQKYLSHFKLSKKTWRKEMPKSSET